jgi:hypothetical protein
MKLITVGILLFATAMCRAHVVADDMTARATDFLSALSQEQRGKAVFDFKNEERLNWHFIPRARKGLPLKEMSRAQRNLAFALFHSGLSDHALTKATNIISLELILREVENGRGPARDTELYFVSIFGKPEAKGTWGWRLEGHHLAANFTIVNGELLSGAPSFFGTNPAEVRSGPRKGLRILAEEEDFGRTLVTSLDAEGRKKAIYEETAPKDILTGAKVKVTPLETAGISFGDLNAEQKAQLKKLVTLYASRVRSEMAATDLERIEKAGWGKVQFAWAGGIEKGQPHYYRVQGPTFLLEYDNTQNDANHVHAVWRDFDNDFGEDLLRRHYRETPHAK